jgi:hypothetical protein
VYELHQLLQFRDFAARLAHLELAKGYYTEALNSKASNHCEAEAKLLRAQQDLQQSAKGDADYVGRSAFHTLREMLHEKRDWAAVMAFAEKFSIQVACALLLL